MACVASVFLCERLRVPVEFGLKSMFPLMFVSVPKGTGCASKFDWAGICTVGSVGFGFVAEDIVFAGAVSAGSCNVGWVGFGFVTEDMVCAGAVGKLQVVCWIDEERIGLGKGERNFWGALIFRR